jgi:transcription termination/antitermination protein NusG
MSAYAVNSKWYALQLRPHHELSVACRLRELGLEEYLPIKKTRSPSKRNRFSEGLPFFPGYIFSFLDLDAGPRLYNIPGIIRIVGYGGRPTPLSNEEMQAIRVMVASQVPIHSVSCFSTGEPIVLVDGPLRGVRGRFIHTKKGGHLTVSLPLLRRSLAVTVLSDWIARDHPSSATAERNLLSA